MDSQPSCSTPFVLRPPSTMNTSQSHQYLHPAEELPVRWTREALDALEPLLAKNTRRFVLFPIKYLAIWRAYKHAVTTFWIADSIDCSKDIDDWENECANVDKKVVGTLILLFEAMDRLHEKIFYSISTMITSPEARCFFGFQAMIENVHREALAKIASALALHPDTIEGMPLNLTGMKSIDRKLTWIQKQSEDTSALFSEKVLLFLFVQGLFSSTVTSIVKWVSDKKTLNGFVYTYNKISVDRETHVNFASLIFYHLERRPPAKYAENLVTEMVEIERSFAEELIRGLDANIPMYSVLREIECIADGLLTSVGYSAMYTAQEDKGEVDKKVTGGLKALYFEHEMATAYTHASSISHEELTFDLTDQ